MTRLLSLTLFTMASVLLSGVNSPARAQGPEPYRKVLTDAEHLQNDGPTEIQRLFVTPACPHAWTVRKVIMVIRQCSGRARCARMKSLKLASQ